MYYVESCVFGVLSVICQQIQKGVNCFFVGFFMGKARSSCLAEYWRTSSLFDIRHVALRINWQVGRVLGEQTHCFIAYLGITAAWKADKLAENHYFVLCGDPLENVDMDRAKQIRKSLNKCSRQENEELKLSYCHANAAQEHVIKPVVTYRQQY